jgi:hypothetical protein
MSDFIAKARLIEKQRGISFREACRVLGKASGRARRERAKAKKVVAASPARVDWHTRWERERERAEGE